MKQSIHTSLRLLATCIILPTLLAACAKSPAKLQAEVDTAISAAKSVKDPWAARQQLYATLKAIQQDPGCQYSIFDRENCNVFFDREEVRRYEDEAVKAGNPEAIFAVHLNKNVDQLSRLAPVIMDVADKAAGVPEDGPILRVAGALVADGRFVQRDTDRALGYLARAWAAGEVRAANDTAVLYQATNDYRNAYLWSLRCIALCDRSSEVRLTELQKMLSTSAIRQAEVAAADKRIVSLDSKP